MPTHHVDLGKQPQHQIAMMHHHPVSRPYDLEAFVEGKERLQQILLVPEDALLEVLLRVAFRQTDVMDVNMNALAKARENFEVDRLNVVAFAEHMRRVDEQDVVLGKRIENRVIQ